ncbi:hypothetical protein ACFSC6_21590 [Rufibacter sediminis]|uniref:Uncharacterized protein n=1 Tax=Rufibacter sediminis TaxID=2762756 RepID=A0ABR6VRB6_9BACT|nr:hypothetical protein [Rufibacter sediminis]MBC3539697.1 hypothetical protein [Rufibacter sediminis]
MEKNHFTYYQIITKKIQAGFRKEEYRRGDHVQEVVLLALQLRFLLTHLEKTSPELEPLREASWYTNLLQHEAYGIISSPKKDTFSYLKAFHDAHEAFLRLLPHMDFE